MPPASAASDPLDTAPAGTFHHLLARQTERTPDALAILAPERAPLTYRRLREQVEGVVWALNGMGLGRGDRVAVVVGDGPEQAVAIPAVAAGAVAVPLHPALTADEAAAVFAGLAPRGLVIAAALDSPVRAVAAARGIAVAELVVPAGAEAGRFDLEGPVGAPPDRPGYAAADDVALLVHTSGTTGRPKRVPHRHANLHAFALSVAVELTGEDRMLNLFPLYHISIGGILGALAAGASVVCPPGFQAPRFFDWLAEYRPTVFSGVPPILQAILARAPAHADAIAGGRLRVIGSGASSLAATTLAELEAVFGVPVIEGYGLTETLTATTNPLPPRSRKPGSVGVATALEVAVVNEFGAPVPTGDPGEVVVRGPTVIAGYDGDPAATAAAFFPDGWFRTGDLGYLDPDGYLFLTGRLKELINRGGEKVAPPEVEEALLLHPAVGQAVAFALPDERMGEEVGAAVVLGEGATATEAELRLFVAERLAPFKVPRRVVFLDRLPLGRTGKPQRIGLAATLGVTTLAPAEGGLRPGYVAPRTPAEEAVARIWEETLALAPIGASDDFVALGGDSVLAALVVARLRRALGVELSVTEFFETPTVAGLAATLEHLVLGRIERRPDDADGRRQLPEPVSTAV